MIEQAPLVNLMLMYSYLLCFCIGMMAYENPLICLLLYYRLKWNVYKPITLTINDVIYENELLFRRLFERY